jgi:HK97 family phage prohead protease
MQQLQIEFEQRGEAQNPPAAILALNGNAIERRAFSTIFQRADEGTGRSITGYAAVFNSTTSIGGWYDEVIEPGAFDEAIGKSDCRALFNHDPNHLLARQSSGTLTLSLDAKGLKYAFEMPEHRADLLEMMERGDLKESSFAFTVREQEWKEEKMGDDEWKYTRVIKKVDMLYDVSPVTYPAYADTSVAKRSLDHFLETRNQKPETEQTPTPPAPTGIPAEVVRLVFG